MKASKFSEAQIAFVLKQAEAGTAIGEVCRKAGISEATFYNWRKRYVGLMPSDVKRLRQLEEENGKLKRLVADLSLDKAMLQDVLQKSSEACPPAPACRCGEGDLEGIGASGLRSPADRPLPLHLQVQARRAGRSQAQDQGDLRDPGPLRLPARTCSLAAGRMANRKRCSAATGAQGHGNCTTLLPRIRRLPPRC